MAGVRAEHIVPQTWHNNEILRRAAGIKYDGYALHGRLEYINEKWARRVT
jgi:hypothetical protein